MIDHLIRNIIKLPTRTVRSTLRALNPKYRLQWEADRQIGKWPQQLRDDLGSVPGTSTRRECRLLAYLVKKGPPGGSIVEIGALRGKTTAWLIEAAQRRDDRPRVVSIDPHIHDTWDEYQNTIKRFDLNNRGLEVHRAMSHDLGAKWKDPISILWIDGGHDYETVAQDIDDFVPHVIPGGWLIFDDADGDHWPDVPRAIDDRMPKYPQMKYIADLKDFRIFQRAAARNNPPV